jgi:hypothetical protein
MKRVLTLATIVAAVLYLAPTPAQAISKRYCMFQNLDREINSHRENDRVAQCMAWHMGVNNATAQYVMDRESGGNEYAYNHASCAEGLYQHICTYWASRVLACRSTLDRFRVTNRAWYSPRANIAVTFCMVKAVGWAPWSTAP